MGNKQYFFLDTGIRELNALLTRNEKFGIPLPTKNGFSSSTTVIRGATGKGKSVLSSIIANNLHLTHPKMSPSLELSKKPKENIEKESDYCNFSIYFSFNQPSKSIYYYIDEIVRSKDNNHEEKPYPLILSPVNHKQFSDKDGVAVLRRFLLKSLEFAIPKIFDNRNENKSISENISIWLETLNSYGWWECGLSDFYKTAPKDVNMLNKIDVHQCKRLIPIVFVDPINFFFHYQDSRQAISELFASFRSLKIPLVVTLEDACIPENFAVWQLARNAEFESDLILELNERNIAHKRNVIEIRKNRNSQPIFGQQMYRIEKKHHSLYNIPHIWQKKHPGILIFRSIHCHMSSSRSRSIPEKRYKSGIKEIDDILLKGIKNKEHKKEALLPPDAFILVRGEKGGHKLSLAFNLLIGGLRYQREKETKMVKKNKQITIEPSENNAILLSLGEETSINIPYIALTKILSHEGSKLEREEETEDDIKSGDNWSAGNKVMIHKWRFKKKEIQDNYPVTGKLIELNFKPGHLSPEEFLWIVESACSEYKPSRILIENTAHLRMRFPELYAEEMLFPALSSFTHKNHIMLIVTDVMGAGSDEILSYGLAACADYICNLNSLDRITINPYIKMVDGKKTANRPGAGEIWSELVFNNIRGKNYLRPAYGVTVLKESFNNQDFNVLLLVKKSDDKID